MHCCDELRTAKGNSSPAPEDRGHLDSPLTVPQEERILLFVSATDVPIIRKAAKSDASSIARVNVDSWRTTYREIVPEDHLAKLSYEDRETIWARAITDPKQITYVAETGGKIIGFANGGKNRDEKSEYRGELYAVYLLQPFQQRGVGRQLTFAIARDLERAGMLSMIVWVLKHNPACEFYQKLGGHPIATNLTLIGGASLEEVAYGWTDVSVLYRHS